MRYFFFFFVRHPFQINHTVQYNIIINIEYKAINSNVHIKYQMRRFVLFRTYSDLFMLAYCTNYRGRIRRIEMNDHKINLTRVKEEEVKGKRSYLSSSRSPCTRIFRIRSALSSRDLKIE